MIRHEVDTRVGPASRRNGCPEQSLDELIEAIQAVPGLTVTPCVPEDRDEDFRRRVHERLRCVRATVAG